eukprot:g5213.t1
MATKKEKEEEEEEEEEDLEDKMRMMKTPPPTRRRRYERTSRSEGRRETKRMDMEPDLAASPFLSFFSPAISSKVAQVRQFIEDSRVLTEANHPLLEGASDSQRWDLYRWAKRNAKENRNDEFPARPAQVHPNLYALLHTRYLNLYRQMRRFTVYVPRRVANQSTAILENSRTRTGAVQLRDSRTGDILRRFILPVEQICLGPHHVKRAGSSMEVDVEFVFGEDTEDGNSASSDSAKLVLSVCFPPEYNPAHFVHATMPAVQTIILAVLVLLWLLINVHWFLSCIALVAMVM